MSILLQAHNLKKSYDTKPLFDGLSLTVSTGQHIGVVGRNGAGKSTLFKIIMGFEEAEEGDVKIHQNARIGYLRQQENPFELTETVIGFLMRSSGKEEWECAKMAGQFHLKKSQLTREIGSFAGGYQMRVKIVAMLLEDPNLLLLDEPTNYLDLSTVLLLEQFLRNFSGSFLLISHDREFLKRTCNETLEIARGKATFFPQPLEEYLAHKEQQEEFARRYNKKIAKEQRHLQSFVDRFRYKSSKASQAQSKLKQLHKLQTIKIEHPIKHAMITIPDVSDKKGTALSVHEMTIGYPEYTVASEMSFHIERGEHVAIVGNNGQGKTTLLKTIAGALEPLAGSYKFGVHMRIGYYAQHVPEMLNPKDQVGDHLVHMAGPDVSEQDVFQMAGNFLFHDEDLKKPISVLSGGEKARLCLAGLLLQKNDVLLLDEPTNHLDFETVEALGAALAETNTTILFVSHNRTFVNNIATSIIEVGGGKVRRSMHDYENYIYHLKERLHIAMPELAEEEVAPNEKKERRIEIREALKQEKKNLHDAEVRMMELEKEKQDLFTWFEEHPNSFSRIKKEQVDNIVYELEGVEKEWLAVQERIDEMEEKLRRLV